jgi:LmbE family N-acetylglucosaminyl deacetylase
MARAATLLNGTLAILSPHLDDAIFSLGAMIAAACRAGSDIRVVTVLAGDPDSTAAAGPWDAECGFATAGEAATARRVEDARACSLVGARPAWMPYGDEQYDRGATEAIWEGILRETADADAVLLPGFPLEHQDHAWLAELCVSRRTAFRALGLYVEQPYTWQGPGLPTYVPDALDGLIDAPVGWERLRAGPADLVTKARATVAYRSQAREIGRRRLLRVIAHEVKRGGEAVGWLGPHPAK